MCSSYARCIVRMCGIKSIVGLVSLIPRLEEEEGPLHHLLFGSGNKANS